MFQAGIKGWLQSQVTENGGNPKGIGTNYKANRNNDKALESSVPFKTGTEGE